LYPHFVPYVTPGWLDKHLPWRRQSQAHPWLANVLLLAPSPKLLARLPNRKLPDRDDFYRYGLDHAARQRDWKRAIAECGRMAEEVMKWLERPDPSQIRPL
ncbi:MAG: patatin-like phospholipase family protein, partial [Burkholderiaceae bacterium]